MLYCEKIKGYNMKLDEQFSLRFNGFRMTIVGITFQVMEETLSATMEIPPHSEMWSKGIPLDVLFYEYFIKPNLHEWENQSGRSESVSPRAFPKDPKGD
jgi:hypothetical protein